MPRRIEVTTNLFQALASAIGIRDQLKILKLPDTEVAGFFHRIEIIWKIETFAAAKFYPRGRKSRA